MSNFLSKAEVEKLLKMEINNTGTPLILNDKEKKRHSLKSFLTTAELTDSEKNLLFKENLSCEEMQLLKDLLLRLKSKTYDEEMTQTLSEKKRMSRRSYDLVVQIILQKKLQNLEIDIDKILIELGFENFYSSCFLASNTIRF